MSWIERFEAQGLYSKWLVVLLMVTCTGVLDYLTGLELSFSLFYVMPVAFAAWIISKKSGYIVAAFSSVALLLIDIKSGYQYSHPAIPVWNTLIRFSFFFIIVMLLSALKTVLEREKNLARTDFLTGAINSRLFFECVAIEIARLERFGHPFTLVYLDLDHFKRVNDELGHSAGDGALRVVVSYARKHLRKTDVIARIGGDEFALLLPETNQDSAQVLLSKLNSGFLSEMQAMKLPITFSVGSVTCLSAPESIDVLMKIADALMYEVKKSGKNAIKMGIFSEGSLR